VIEATRLSGPAPLAVQFDASRTTTTDGSLPFHQIRYEFNFGNERDENWAHSGLPKNIQRGGPIGSHVFDQPGTYTVRVRATAANGAYSDATVQVTVQDPNTFYAGTATVCVSGLGNFAGCPAGALQQGTLPSPLTGKRVLLRRGETFPSVSLRNTDNNFQIGAFGIGAKPTIGGLRSSVVAGATQWASNFTVMDLNIGSGAVSFGATVVRALLYRNDIRTPGSTEAMVDVGTAVGYYHDHGTAALRAAIPWPREVFIVENDIQGVVSPSGGPILVVMGSFYQSALLGNNMDRATQHTFRAWSASKTQISHNRIGGNHYTNTFPGIRGAVKIHSGGVQPFTQLVSSSRQPATSQVIMSNNVIGSTTYPGSFLSGFSPQNADTGTVEGLEDCIAENNVYIRGAYSSKELDIRGRRITARGNTLLGGGTPSISRSGHTYDSRLSSWDGPYFLQSGAN